MSSSSPNLGPLPRLLEPGRIYENLTATALLAGKNIAWSTSSTDRMLRFCSAHSLCSTVLDPSLLLLLMTELGFDTRDQAVYVALLEKVVSWVERNVTVQAMRPGLRIETQGGSLGPRRCMWATYTQAWDQKTGILDDCGPQAGEAVEFKGPGEWVKWISPKMCVEVVVEAWKEAEAGMTTMPTPAASIGCVRRTPSKNTPSPGNHSDYGHNGNVRNAASGILAASSSPAVQVQSTNASGSSPANNPTASFLDRLATVTGESSADLHTWFNKTPEKLAEAIARLNVSGEAAGEKSGSNTDVMNLGRGGSEGAVSRKVTIPLSNITVKPPTNSNRTPLTSKTRGVLASSTRAPNASSKLTISSTTSPTARSEFTLPRNNKHSALTSTTYRVLASRTTSPTAISRLTPPTDSDRALLTSTARGALASGTTTSTTTSKHLKQLQKDDQALKARLAATKLEHRLNSRVISPNTSPTDSPELASALASVYESSSLTKATKEGLPPLSAFYISSSEDRDVRIGVPGPYLASPTAASSSQSVSASAPRRETSRSASRKGRKKGGYVKVPGIYL